MEDEKQQQSYNNTTNRKTESKYRKRKLVLKHSTASALKYNVWLGGHICCVVFGVISYIYGILWLPNKWYLGSIVYRLSLYGGLAALVATLSHKFGLHYLPPFTTLLAQNNFQYLVLNSIWSVTFRSVFKQTPLFLISALQLSDHFKINAVMNHSDTLGNVIAGSELILVVYLLLRTLFFRGTAGYQLTVMLTFMWLRILFDKPTAQMFSYLVQKADTKMSQIQNPKVQKFWPKVKGFIEEKLQSHFY